MEDYKTQPKYHSYVEDLRSVLGVFDKSKEWADLIRSLQRLNKVFLKYPQYSDIPESSTVAKRLAQCMNPALPSGVHLKALETYTLIFQRIGVDGLATEAPLFTAGLLPIYQHASMQLRPAILQMVERFFLPLGKRLKHILPGLVVNLLPGLEETSSEFFERTLNLMDQLCAAVDSEQHVFFRAMWTTIISSTSGVRHAALTFMNSRYSRYKGTDSDFNFFLADSPSLVARAIKMALLDHSVLVQRSVLDLLVSAFRLDCSSFCHDDVVRICQTVLIVLLRRELSLQRRIFTWLVGGSSVDEVYMARCSLPVVAESIRELLLRAPNDVQSALQPYKILAVLLDKEVFRTSGLLKNLIVPIIQYMILYGNDENIATASFAEEVRKVGLKLVGEISTAECFEAMGLLLQTGCTNLLQLRPSQSPESAEDAAAATKPSLSIRVADADGKSSPLELEKGCNSLQEHVHLIGCMIDFLLPFQEANVPPIEGLIFNVIDVLNVLLYSAPLADEMRSSNDHVLQLVSSVYGLLYKLMQFVTDPAYGVALEQVKAESFDAFKSSLCSAVRRTIQVALVENGDYKRNSVYDAEVPFHLQSDRYRLHRGGATAVFLMSPSVQDVAVSAFTLLLRLFKCTDSQLQMPCVPSLLSALQWLQFGVKSRSGQLDSSPSAAEVADAWGSVKAATASAMLAAVPCPHAIIDACDSHDPLVACTSIRSVLHLLDRLMTPTRPEEAVDQFLRTMLVDATASDTGTQTPLKANVMESEPEQHHSGNMITMKHVRALVKRLGDILWNMLSQSLAIAHSEVASLFTRLHSMFPTECADVVSDKLADSRLDVRGLIRGYERFTLLWRLLDDTDCVQDGGSASRLFSGGLLILLDGLRHSEPAIQLICRTWLRTAVSRIERILDPLLLLIIDHARVAQLKRILSDDIESAGKDSSASLAQLIRSKNVSVGSLFDSDRVDYICRLLLVILEQCAELFTLQMSSKEVSPDVLRLYVDVVFPYSTKGKAEDGYTISKSIQFAPSNYLNLLVLIAIRWVVSAQRLSDMDNCASATDSLAIELISSILTKVMPGDGEDSTDVAVFADAVANTQKRDGSKKDDSSSGRDGADGGDDYCTSVSTYHLLYRYYQSMFAERLCLVLVDPILHRLQECISYGRSAMQVQLLTLLELILRRLDIACDARRALFSNEKTARAITEAHQRFCRSKQGSRSQAKAAPEYVPLNVMQQLDSLSSYGMVSSPSELVPDAGDVEAGAAQHDFTVLSGDDDRAVINTVVNSPLFIPTLLTGIHCALSQTQLQVDSRLSLRPPTSSAGSALSPTETASSVRSSSDISGGPSTAQYSDSSFSLLSHWIHHIILFFPYCHDVLPSAIASMLPSMCDIILRLCTPNEVNALSTQELNSVLSGLNGILRFCVLDVVEELGFSISVSESDQPVVSEKVMELTRLQSTSCKSFSEYYYRTHRQMYERLFRNHLKYRMWTNKPSQAKTMLLKTLNKRADDDSTDEAERSSEDNERDAATTGRPRRSSGFSLLSITTAPVRLLVDIVKDAFTSDPAQNAALTPREETEQIFFGNLPKILDSFVAVWRCFHLNNTVLQSLNAVHNSRDAVQPSPSANVLAMSNQSFGRGHTGLEGLMLAFLEPLYLQCRIPLFGSCLEVWKRFLTDQLRTQDDTNTTAHAEFALLLRYRAVPTSSATTHSGDPSSLSPAVIRSRRMRLPDSSRSSKGSVISRLAGRRPSGLTSATGSPRVQRSASVFSSMPRGTTQQDDVVVSNDLEDALLDLLNALPVITPQASIETIQAVYELSRDGDADEVKGNTSFNQVKKHSRLFVSALNSSQTVRDVITLSFTRAFIIRLHDRPGFSENSVATTLLSLLKEVLYTATHPIALMMCMCLIESYWTVVDQSALAAKHKKELQEVLQKLFETTVISLVKAEEDFNSADAIFSSAKEKSPAPVAGTTAECTNATMLRVLADVGGRVLETVFEGQSDRIVSLLSTLWGQVHPILRSYLGQSQGEWYKDGRPTRTLAVARASVYLLQQFSHLSFHAVKSIRKDIWDLFLGKHFFEQDTETLISWSHVLDRVLRQESTALFTDLLAKMSENPVNLPLFGKGSEEAILEHKATLLKRASFAMFCGRRDQYNYALPTILEKLSECIRACVGVSIDKSSTHYSRHGAELVVQIFFAVEVLLTHMSAKSLVSFWPTVLTELVRVLQQSSSVDVRILDEAIHLIDMFLIIVPEYFNQYDWIFVSSTQPHSTSPNVSIGEGAKLRDAAPVIGTVESPSRPMFLPLLLKIANAFPADDHQRLAYDDLQRVLGDWKADVEATGRLRPLLSGYHVSDWDGFVALSRWFVEQRAKYFDDVGMDSYLDADMGTIAETMKSRFTELK